MGMTVEPRTTPKTIEVVPPARNETWPLLLAAVFVVVAVLGAIVAIVLRGGEESTPAIMSILGFAATLIVPLFALIKAQQVGTKVEAVGQQVQENAVQTVALRIEMDGRFTAITEMIRVAALAEGRAAGSADERQALADTLATQAAATALVLEKAAAAAALVLSQAQTQAPSPQAVGPQEVVIVGTSDPVPVTFSPGAAGDAPQEVTVIPGAPQPVVIVQGEDSVPVRITDPPDKEG